MTTEADERQTIRRQRNRFALAAVFLLLASLGLSLPRAMARRATLKALNDELVQLQASITDTQQKTTYAQRDIRNVQGQIQALLKSK